MPKEMQFKVSSALKDIIGRDLINDDLIAIFELVKNSYDAHATRVDIYFENLYKDNPSIKIVDNGKGMSFDDLRDKWLFLAYSAKKDGTEDDGTDFRDKINTKRAYAGAKGIGRFSCDRLGSKLLLETTKENSQTEVLDVDWEKFEEDAKKEFIDISVNHKTVNDDKEYGTILTITNLRNQWDRKQLLKLKDALAKLINPNQSNQEDTFEIYLHSKDEENEDKKNDEYYKRINGKIENLIFETLDLKTSKIITEVFERGGETIIKTSLFEANQLVYWIEEASAFKYLHNIIYTIYFLNQSSKSTFSRRMGMQPIEYGHIFIYKNGIRIYPYGERGEDPLKMDNRKAQGYARYLGTREVIGYIDIKENTDFLKETSSRGDGLVKNEAYLELENLFYITLKRLEKYNLDVTKWGNVLTEDYVSLNDDERFEALLKLIKNLANTDDIIDIDYGDKIIQMIEKKESSSASTILKEIKKDLSSGKIDAEKALMQVSNIEKKFSSLQKEKAEAETEAEIKRQLNKELELKKEQTEEQVFFLESIQPLEKSELIKLQHHIGLYADSIEDTILDFSMFLDENESITKDEAMDYMARISFAVQNIIVIKNYATKAKFLSKSDKIEADIVRYINEYINQIYLINNTRELKVIVHTNSIQKKCYFEPMRLSIILDNLLSNSKKAEANKVDIIFKEENNILFMDYIDNGIGLDESIVEPNDIFKNGITRTLGSGIGMGHVKESLEKLNKSTIDVFRQTKGIKFNIRFNL